MEHGTGFEDLYDEATLVRLGAGPRTGGSSGRGERSWRSRAAAGALVSALGLGLAEAFDPAPRRPRIVEIDPGADDLEPGPVTVHLVPGDPRASVVVVRPWLLAC